MTPKERAELIRNLESTVLRWAREDGYKAESTHPQPDHEWAVLIRLETLGFGLQVIRPKGQHRIILAARINMSPEDIERVRKLSRKDKMDLVFELRGRAFAGGIIGVGFTGSDEEFILESWTLDIGIYDDALSQHEFALAVRRLVSRHVELTDILAHRIGAHGPRPGSAAGGPAYA